MILVDSNVLIDLIEPKGAWQKWSEDAISSAGEDLAVNPVIVAEIARQFETLGDEMNFLAALGTELLPIEAEAAYRAGRAHAAYRASGGGKEGILADFLIGGHAQALGAKLLTRDKRRFASYFPDLNLISPEP